MKAEVLAEFARLLSGDEIVVVECEGYELEVHSVEYDEYEGVLRLKAAPPDDDDETPPWLENDDDEGPPGSVLDGRNVCPIERPMETFQIDGPEPVQG